MKHDIAIGCTGRFRAVAHKGHTYNEDGSIATEGEVVVVDGVPQETQFGRNKLTLKYLNDIINGEPSIYGCIVAGSGNTTPAETDTTLTSYVGRCTSHIGATGTYIDTPDENGNLYMRTVFRATFAPGALGSGTKNIAEAGVATGTTGSVDSLSPLLAHGLLVDGMGNPTTVSLDASTEYLDIFWEITRYFKAEDSGTINIGIEGTPTAHDWVMRPMNWRQLANAGNYLWPWDGYVSSYLDLKTMFKPGFPFSGNTTNTATVAASGPLGTFAEYPTKTGFSASAHSPSAITIQAKTADKQRTWLIRFGTTQGNVSGGVGALQLAGDSTPGWQISYSPVFDKDEDKQLDLYVTVYVDNMP